MIKYGEDDPNYRSVLFILTDIRQTLLDGKIVETLDNARSYGSRYSWPKLEIFE